MLAVAFGLLCNSTQSWSQAANNNFANGITLGGTAGSVAGTNVGATGEAGEPNPGANSVLNSIWYRWTAPTAGTITFDTCTAFSNDPHLAAFTGTAVNALTTIAFNDDSCGLGSRITFAVTSGTTYHIQADGYNAAVGSFTLSYAFTAAPPALAVTPAGNFVAAGPQNGPFTVSSPPSGQYTIQNTGGGTLNWTVSGPSWLTFSAASGALTAGATTVVTVTVRTADPAAAAAGSYSGTITFGGNGGTATRSATLTVNDTTLPTITGTPANISVNTPSNSATAVATWTAPTASDNVGVTSFTSNFAPGASFPIGTTTVIYTARDAAGNVRTASFTVTVTDNVGPVIASCPANQTIQATGPGGAVATWTAPTASDNSGTATLAGGAPGSGSTFPIGIATVTYTATDPSSNAATPCVFTIRVQDTTAPVFSGVPANVTIEATSPAGATYTYTLPTATDLVAGSRPVTTTRASGSTFPFTAPGPTATTVTFGASDTAAPPNSASASFVVTVRDTTAPVLAGVPANMTVEATGPGGATVTYAAATATDAADAAPVITYSQASGTVFPVGTTTVTVSARDASSNASSATFTVTVRDTTPPVIAGVPANITREATGPSGAVVTYTLPTATDLVTAPITVVASPASGATFPIGVTSVSFTATDAAGNIASASFQVTVTDLTAPVFSGVPGTITREATGPTGAVVTYALPTATDLVDGARPVTTSQASGTTFPIGTTTVTFSASDLASPANTATATLQIIVQDTIAPTIANVPANITVNTPPGSATAIATWMAPTASDAVGVTTFAPDFASGAGFPIGVTTVTYTARDAAGHVTTASFTVTVLDNVPPVIASCPANQTVEATGPTGAAATWSAPTATDNSGGAVTLNGSATPGAVFPLAATSVTYTATDASSNSAICSFTITVRDTTAPAIASVPANISITTSAGGTSGIATWTAPTATDAVGVATFTSTHASGASFPVGTTTVTYTARDAAGNTSTGSFTVTVTDNVAPVFSGVPANVTVEATGPTGAVFTYPLPTANDTLDGPVAVSTTQASGTTFPLGLTIVTFSARDAANNTVTATFQVLVQDTISPVISGMPANITVNAPPGSATATVSWTAPTATDAVGVTSFTSNFAPGAAFPVGTTSVIYTARDAAGHTTTASFNVTVVDNVAPVISGLPANITIEATGPLGAAVTYVLPTAVDAVDGPVAVTVSNASGSTFPIGTTTVTISATDAASNTATATFQVLVRDTTAPLIASVPANITISTPPGSSTAAPSWTPPMATDAVGVVSFTSNFAPGASFPVGTTTVVYTARDAAGNVTTASFTVTVVDDLPPTLVGIPADIVIEATGPSGAVVTYTLPTANDLVDGPRPVTTSRASGTTFPLGATTVTFSASDLAAPANTATATFQVTVRDTTPPVIGAVANITVTAPDLIGMAVTFALPAATDVVDTTPTVTAAPASGSFFAIGVHTVTVTAVDDFSNAATKTFTVTVLSPAQMSVTPVTGLVSTGPQGQQGALFGPTSQAYTVTNNGQVPMGWSVAGAPAWATASPAGGTLAPGASATVTVALNAGADALAVGLHTGSVAFTNTTSAIGSTTRPVSLTVLAPAAMTVTPATAFLSTGPQGQQGGSFAPASTTYVVTNTGALPMDYAVTGQPSWVTVSPANGTLAAGASATVTVALNAAANALPVGGQTGTLSFANSTNALGNTTRGVTLNVLEPARLTVTAADGLAAGGFQGGPFSPATKVYTLTNSGAVPMSFTATDDQGWLDTAPASGTIPPGGSVTVTLSINAAANALGNGTHTGTLTLTNVTSGLGSTTRPAVLTVAPNGQVVLKVVTAEGDGTFTFASPASALNLAVTTSGGTGQTAAVTLNPGSYEATATLPSGFGLTSVTCSDSDSTGNVGSKSATIVLASAETITCTFVTANSRKKTVEVISRFMGRRNDMMLSNGPDVNRQVDRLIEAAGETNGGGPGGAPAFASSEGKGQGPSRLAASGDAGFTSPVAGPGTRAMGEDARQGSGIGRSFDERLSGLGVGTLAPAQPADGGLSPMKITGNTEGSSRLGFATSLSQITRFNDDVRDRKAKGLSPEEAMAAGLSGAMPTPRRAFSPLDIWAEGTFVNFTDDRNRAEIDGHYGVMYFGADYVVNPRLLIGALVQFDTMEQRSQSNAFSIKGHGWMVGPYATVRLTDNVFLQGRAAMGQSDNEVSPFLTYTDTFSTRRWLTTGSLVGRWQFGDLQLRPSASLAYIEDTSSAYTDSLGVGIPGLKVSLGQAKAGPEISYRFKLPDGSTFEPRLGLEAIWNFTNSNQVADFGGTLTGPEDLRGRLELGFRAQRSDGVVLDVSGSFDGLGSGDYQSIGAKATIRVPLQ